MTTNIRFVRGALAVLIAVSMAGCTDKGAQAPRGKTRPGVVTKIDLQTRNVAMKIKTDDNVEQEHSGTISDDTEILINGRAAKLADVHIGERVDVTVQKSKTEDGKFDIKRVEITRASDSDWKATGTTTQPPAPVNPGLTPSNEAAPTPSAPKAAPPPAPTPSNNPPTPPRASADTAAPKPVEDIGMADPTQEAAKQDLTDLIYAQIRVRMEEALVKRADLLKAGTSQNDPSVAEFERQIIRARSFLSERGELLDDVAPPLAGISAPAAATPTPTPTP